MKPLQHICDILHLWLHSFECYFFPKFTISLESSTVNCLWTIVKLILFSVRHLPLATLRSVMKVLQTPVLVGNSQSFEQYHHWLLYLCKIENCMTQKEVFWDIMCQKHRLSLDVLHLTHLTYIWIFTMTHQSNALWHIGVMHYDTSE